MATRIYDRTKTGGDYVVIHRDGQPGFRIGCGKLREAFADRDVVGEPDPALLSAAQWTDAATDVGVDRVGHLPDGTVRLVSAPGRPDLELLPVEAATLVALLS